MKGKEEDDDGKPKSANGSMQIKDLSVHVELEQQPDCSRFQQVREAACLTEFTTLQLFYDSSFFRAKSLVVFEIFMYKFLLR